MKLFSIRNELDENIPDQIRLCLKYFKEQNLMQAEPGSYTIDGDNLFVNVMEYDTQSRGNRDWEAHKQYADLHILLSGYEEIEMGFTENMFILAYDPKKDCVSLEGSFAYKLFLTPQIALYCDPSDAHKTGITCQGTHLTHIKKAVFKIKIEKGCKYA